MDPDNRAAINLDGAVGLARRAASTTLVARLPADGRRPLAADRAQMERLYAVRQIAYAQAHLRVERTAPHADAVVERIVEHDAPDWSGTRSSASTHGCLPDPLRHSRQH